MAKLLFWISAGFAVYVYIGYPVLLCVLQSVFRASPRRRPIEPSVSLLVAAYNEAAVIAEKVRNSLALDYPAAKLEVVIASDGSEDATAEIVRSFSGSETGDGGRVRL
ncbi:MAG: glycosyltransferase, partial [Terriglobales bacterium]